MLRRWSLPRCQCSPRAPARPPAAAPRPERGALQCRECQLLPQVSSVSESTAVKARHGFRVSPWCGPVLTSPFTHREQLQPRHQVQRPSPAQASPAAPTAGSPALHSEASRHSHWACSFGQTLADSPLQNLGLLPIIRAGSPNSSAEPSELENRALRFLSPTSHSPLHAADPSLVSNCVASGFVAHALLW